MTPVEWVSVGVFGLMVGSFLNVCISRLPAGESIVSPASRCPGCRTPILWRDNLPLVSWVALRGRCRHCQTSISARYPAVEVATALIFVAQAGVVGPGWLGEGPVLLALASRLVLSALLVALLVTDLETFRLPNPLTYFGIAAGLVLSAFGSLGLREALLGAAVGAAVLWLIREAWLRAKGVDAMGLGDVKMLAMIGAFLGWPQVWVVLLLSSVVGAVVGLVLTVSGRGTMQSKLPFGVFLALAALIASVWGHDLIEWYLGGISV